MLSLKSYLLAPQNCLIDLGLFPAFFLCFPAAPIPVLLVLKSLFSCPISCKFIACSAMPYFALKCHFEFFPVKLVGEVLKMAFLDFSGFLDCPK